MLARIRKQLDEENGFTLVELLVVIIIIGILAAIAIPLYLGQQARARDAALQSDLKQAQIAAASILVDDPTGATLNNAAIVGEITTSPGVAITSTIFSAPDTFCVGGTVTNGDVGSFSIDEGGTMFEGTVNCT